MKIVLAAVPYINTRIPPLSLALLAGQLRREGFSVRCLDFNISAYQTAPADLKRFWKMTQGFQWSDEEIYRTILGPKIVEPNLGRWVDAVQAENPDVLGISVTDAPVAKVLAQAVKDRIPGIKVVAGGPSCSRAYTGHAFSDFSHVDAVVDGEGEAALVELLRVYADTGTFASVTGVTVRGVDGQEVFGGVRAPIKDISALAFPDFSDFDLNLYTDEDSYGGEKKARELPVYSSRGCVAKCRYCMDYKIWQSYRFKDPVRFVDELEHLWENFGARQFFFVELLLNGSHRWLREFSAEIRRRKRHFPFHSHGRISASMNAPLLRDLRKAGLFHINYGLESASNRVLEKMWKGYKIAEAARCIRDTHEAGISMTINLVIGFPGENTWDRVKTIGFILRHRRFIHSKPNLAICDAIAGSDLYLYPEQFGIEINKDDPQFYMSWRTTDGRNTYRVRKWRCDVMDYIFSRVRFGESFPAGKNKEGWGQRLYRIYIAQPRKRLASFGP